MIENYFYLAALVVSISCLMLTDYRYKLAFWYDQRRSAITISIVMAVFILWDIIGIKLGLFFKGNSQYMLPFEILPEFPLEELFFLFLLAYVSLLLYRGANRWLPT